MSLLMVLFSAFAAFAHHPNIGAEAKCADEAGKFLVSYDATTWEASGPRGLHQDVRIGWGTATPTSLSGGTSSSAPYATRAGSGAFTGDNGRSFDGDFTVSDDLAGQTIYVYAWAHGKWGPSGDRSYAGNEWRVKVLTLPTESCDIGVQPVAPTVVQSTVCEVEGTVTIPTTTGVIYRWNGTGPNISGEELAGPRSGSVVAEAADGYALTGTTSFPVNIAAAEDCPPPPPPPEEPPAPEVDVTAECADEDGTVTVAVDGIRDGETLTITLDDQVRTVTSDGSVTFEDVADGEYTVVTTSSEGDVDQEDSVTVDCDVPPPPPEVDALNVECTDEGLTVIDLSEQPDVTGVTVDGEAIEVPEGGVLELDLPAGSHDIVITRSDADPITLTVDCPKPEEPEPTVEPTDEPTVEPTDEPTPAPTPQEPQVKGETIERELAATGASSGLLALAAAVLAGLGALMVVGTRSGATPGARLARAVTDAPPLPRRLFTSRVGPAIRFRGGLPSRAARGSARTVRRPGRWRHWRE